MRHCTLKVLRWVCHGVIIKFLDDLNQTTTVVLTAAINNTLTSNIQLDMAFSSCVGEHIILKGMPEEATALYLHTITPRLSYTRLMIKIVECPPGFKHDSALQECVCNADEYAGLVKCIWTSLVSDADDRRIEIATSFCPLRFAITMAQIYALQPYVRLRMLKLMVGKGRQTIVEWGVGKGRQVTYKKCCRHHLHGLGQEVGISLHAMSVGPPYMSL